MILDFGCGIGNWLRKNRRGFAVGVDIDRNVLKRAKQLCGNEEIDFLVCDCHHLPFRGSSFSYVHDGFALHHMKDWHRGVEEISRVLAGQAEIVEAISDNPLFAVGRRLLKRWGKQEINSYFTSKELRMEITKNGFIVESEHYGDDLFNYIPGLNLYMFSLLSEPGVTLPRLYVSVNKGYNWLLRRMHLDKRLASAISINAVKGGEECRGVV